MTTETKQVTPFAATLTKPVLSERQQALADRFNEHNGGDKPNTYNMTKKEFYGVLGTVEGIDVDAYKEQEKIGEDVAVAIHAVVTERALAAIQSGAESYAVNVNVGEHAHYEDSYRKSIQTTVRNPKTGETSERTLYGSHRPVIKTKYSSLKKERAASMQLAAELFGAESK